MSGYKMRCAFSDEEKDLHEIMAIWAVFGLAIGGGAAFLVMGLPGAVLGGMGGAALGAWIAHRIVAHAKDIAREIKFYPSHRNLD